jgi:hypothetical protein
LPASFKKQCALKNTPTQERMVWNKFSAACSGTMFFFPMRVETRMLLSSVGKLLFSSSECMENKTRKNKLTLACKEQTQSLLFVVFTIPQIPLLYHCHWYLANGK